MATTKYSCLCDGLSGDRTTISRNVEAEMTCNSLFVRVQTAEPIHGHIAGKRFWGYQGGIAVTGRAEVWTHDQSHKIINIAQLKRVTSMEVLVAWARMGGC